MTSSKDTSISKPTIQKGCPIPTSGRKGAPFYPFADMLIGDSFVIPNTPAKGGLYGNAKARGMKITVRMEGDKLRVWRIK